MSNRPPAPSGSGQRYKMLSDESIGQTKEQLEARLLFTKIRYYEAKAAYYEKLSAVSVTIPPHPNQWPNWGMSSPQKPLWTPSRPEDVEDFAFTPVDSLEAVKDAIANSSDIIVGTQGFSPHSFIDPKESSDGQADQETSS